MTATVELERIARDVVPPVGATQAVAMVAGTPGGRLPSGAPSGIGVATRYGAAWLVDGLRQSKAIALFDRQSDALRLVRILNGDVQASRSAAEIRTSPLPTEASGGASLLLDPVAAATSPLLGERGAATT